LDNDKETTMQYLPKEHRPLDDAERRERRERNLRLDAEERCSSVAELLRLRREKSAQYDTEMRLAEVALAPGCPVPELRARSRLGTRRPGVRRTTSTRAGPGGDDPGGDADGEHEPEVAPRLEGVGA
jgi:hypothetical protein